MLKQRDYADRAQGSLSGVRIVDLSRLFAGNLLTQILGDFGAEVIKVEPPAGDTLRAWQTDGIATNWKVYARNKKSLCLELRKAAARDLLLRLVPSAAIFVESFRPGTLETMGLGPEKLQERNPRLLYNLGVLLEDLDRKKEALAAYQAALRGDPALADCHYNLALLYESLGRKKEAIRHLAQYRKLTRRPK